jgi:hypothetical protein
VTGVQTCALPIFIETCYNDQVFPKEKFSMMEIQAQVFEHFVYGLCTEKGKKLYMKYKESNHKQQINTPVI